MSPLSAQDLQDLLGKRLSGLLASRVQRTEPPLALPACWDFAVAGGSDRGHFGESARTGRARRKEVLCVHFEGLPVSPHIAPSSASAPKLLQARMPQLGRALGMQRRDQCSEIGEKSSLIIGAQHYVACRHLPAAAAALRQDDSPLKPYSTSSALRSLRRLRSLRWSHVRARYSVRPRLGADICEVERAARRHHKNAPPSLHGRRIESACTWLARKLTCSIGSRSREVGRRRLPRAQHCLLCPFPKHPSF